MTGEDVNVRLKKDVAQELHNRKKIGDTYSSVVKKLLESKTPRFDPKKIK
jgi:hypothetical protein